MVKSRALRVIWTAGLAAAAGVALGGWLSLESSTSNSLASLVPANIKNGALIVFSPGSCSSHADVLRALSRLDSMPGLNVVGQVTLMPDLADQVDSIKREFGITFALIPYSQRRGHDPLSANGLSTPVVFVMRQGRLEAVLSGSALDRLAPTLTNVFGGM